ncbi:hypothetical protein ABMA79_14915 [Halobacteriovorax sp. HFRX-2_2]|uniref:hypothetical protein n=1 Tax=unclassified Halobacteriovorax TaxID=2639665 RepID=UPI00371ED0B5
MKSENAKLIRSFIAIAISFSAVWYASNQSSNVSRSTASFNPIGNCFHALKGLLKNYDVKVGRDVSILMTDGRNIEGKIATYSRGGFQINSKKGNYLISYSEVEKINNDILSEIEIYKKLLEDDISKIQGQQANIHYHNGYDFSNIVGSDFEIGEKTLNFTSVKDGRRMTFAYEKIYDISIINRAKETKKIRQDVKLFEGEFVTVELKTGENFDGEIALSPDGSRVDIFDIDNPEDVVSIPVTDIKSIYQ